MYPVPLFLRLMLMLTTTIAAVSISEGGTREEAGDNNGNYTRFRTTVDMGSQKRLRERWNAFMAERAKGISFDQKASSPSLIHSVRHGDSFITCATDRPLSGGLKMSFLRVDLLQLVAVGTRIHNGDKRIQVMRPEPKVWTLRIRDSDPTDSGPYECQINSDPEPTRKLFTLRVVDSHIEILPSVSSLEVEQGTNLVLTCVVDAGPIVPAYILWYRDQRLVEYSGDARTEVFFGPGEGGSHQSELLIKNVVPGDSGEYLCGSDVSRDTAKIAVKVSGNEDTQNHPGEDKDVPTAGIKPLIDDGTISSSSAAGSTTSTLRGHLSFYLIITAATTQTTATAFMMMIFL